MRHEQDGHGRVADHGAELARGGGAGARVQGRERLVEQQRRRAAGERARERHALALAARQRRRARVGAVAEPEALQQRPGARLALGARQLVQGVGDVAPRVQVPEQRVLLEQVAAAPPLGRDADAARRVEPELLSAGDAAARGREQAGHRAQHARLAGARRARQREALAGRHLELEVELHVAAEPRAGRHGQPGGHRATASGPRTSLTESRIAADTATSTAESASASVKSVAKRS